MIKQKYFIIVLLIVIVFILFWKMPVIEGHGSSGHSGHSGGGSSGARGGGGGHSSGLSRGGHGGPSGARGRGGGHMFSHPGKYGGASDYGGGGGWGYWGWWWPSYWVYQAEDQILTVDQAPTIVYYDPYARRPLLSPVF